MIRHLRVMALALVFGVFALAATACESQPASNSANQNAAATSTNTPSSADRDFMTKAAIGGMAEVELGRMASQKGANDAVKAFGRRMVEDHSRASDELKQLASQKGVTLPTDLDARHKETMDRLSKLTGAAFDTAYMTDMVSDHAEDVADFEREASQGQDSDVKGWAARTLPTLRDHLQMARDTASRVGGGTPPAAANSNAGRAGANANAGGAAANSNAGRTGNANAGRTGNANARRPGGNSNRP